MFTRRQAIRWAELWLSCWNDGDFDTLLAMHKDTARFGTLTAGSASVAKSERIEAMKRHWAALPFGLHSVPVEFDEMAWDPESREITVVYVADFDGMLVRGCDLVTLDVTGRVIAGEPCVGSIVDEPRAAGQSQAREWILSETAGGR